MEAGKDGYLSTFKILASIKEDSVLAARVIR